MEKITAIYTSYQRFPAASVQLVHREKGITSAGWFYRFQTTDNKWMLLDLAAVKAFEFAEKPDGRPA